MNNLYITYNFSLSMKYSARGKRDPKNDENSGEKSASESIFEGVNAAKERFKDG